MFEAAGHAAAFRLSVEAVRPAGQVVWLGKINVNQEVSFRWGSLMGEKRIVRSSYGDALPKRDFPWLCSLWLAGKLELDALITRRIVLDEINDGFAGLARGEGIRTVDRIRRLSEPAMKHPPLAADHVDAPHRELALGDLKLESGEAIVDYRQSYVTHGTLDAGRSNAVLICASLSGTHHRLDFLIGPGKALDPARWFVIATDPIGNGLSTSPSNSAAQPGMRFPRFALRDMVAAQHRLLTEGLGIERLHAVVGASMGGMQALQWAVSHPRFMARIVAMTPMAKTAPWAVLVTEAARSCLMADPAWTGDGFSAEPERGRRAFVAPDERAGDEDATGARGSCATATMPIAGSTACSRSSGRSPSTRTTSSTSRGPTRRTTSARAPASAATPRRRCARCRPRRWSSARRSTCSTPRPPAATRRQRWRTRAIVEIPSEQGHQAATSLVAEDAAFLNRVVGEFLSR